jgi:hypothetical protein
MNRAVKFTGNCSNARATSQEIKYFPPSSTRKSASRPEEGGISYKNPYGTRRARHLQFPGRGTPGPKKRHSRPP